MNIKILLSLITSKVYWPSPVISICLKWKLCPITRIYAASHRFLIKLRQYGIDQSYLRKVPWYLIDWRLFVYNDVIYIWYLKDILLLYIFWSPPLDTYSWKVSWLYIDPFTHFIIYYNFIFKHCIADNLPWN